MDVSMKRNGSAYYDETPAKAFEGMAKPGEIWTVGYGAGEKEILVIKNHGRFCNFLSLKDKSNGQNCIEIISRSVKYTDPGMLAWMFCDNLAQFVKALSEEEFNDVLDEIEDALCINIDQVESDLEAAEEKIKVMEAELAQMKHEVKVMEAELEAERKKPSTNGDSHYKDLYQKLVFDLIDRGLMGVVML